MLIADGANVVMAASLEEADALIDQGGIDSAVLDVNVHGEKSYAIGERLRSLDIPFIFATGYGDTSHPPLFTEIPTVSKPYTHDQIKAALAEAPLAFASARRS